MLSGAMMFRLLGWREVAQLIEDGIRRTIEQKLVTYDFHRLMEGATKVRTSEFGQCVIENMAVTLPVAAD
jgi:isocitrate dehydrogenase